MRRLNEAMGVAYDLDALQVPPWASPPTCAEALAAAGQPTYPATLALRRLDRDEPNEAAADG